jgi:DNA-binding Lrp family transcriptional regulator
VDCAENVRLFHKTLSGKDPSDMSKPTSLRELDGTDQRLLNELQDEVPLVPNPFRELGTSVGISEREAMWRIQALHESGVVQQLGPIYDIEAMGYSSSVVAMRIAPESLAEAVGVVNAHPGVSGIYERDHRFNLWLTIVVPPGADVHSHVDALHHMTGAEATRMLPALRQFKSGVTLDMTGEKPLDERSTPPYENQIREVATGTLSSQDFDTIQAVQGGLEIVSEPFSGPEQIDALASLQRRGFLRRFAATLGYEEAGFGTNGMAVWCVPEADVLRIGKELARYSSVSHCFQSPTYEDWPYNVFTMIHARTKAECRALVVQLSSEYGLDDFDVLYSTHEYKDVHLPYFTSEWDEWEDKYLYAGRLAHAV